MSRFSLPLAVLFTFAITSLSQGAGPFGSSPDVGCLEKPRKVERLEITRPGVYENYLVDSNWQGGNRVKITADDVTLRHCEIRNATGNGIGVFSKNVVIENCKIHHLLNSTYSDQADAHGITGHPANLTIRNCEIFYVSGDCLQFDPDRQRWDEVTVENCSLWTGPLPEAAGKFKVGERPGENAFDSKVSAAHPRSRIKFRNCLFYGWRQPSQISLVAAINAKENVELTVENCLFRDNQVCFRLRGPGKNGGAHVTIRSCLLFDSDVGIRMEDRIENLKIEKLGFGTDVVRKYHQVGGPPGEGFTNTGEFVAEKTDK